MQSFPCSHPAGVLQPAARSGESSSRKSEANNSDGSSGDCNGIWPICSGMRYRSRYGDGVDPWKRSSTDTGCTAEDLCFFRNAEFWSPVSGPGWTMKRKETGGALVIGGSGALGGSVVRRLAMDWEFVDFTYCLNKARAEELATALDGVAAHALDITDEQALADVVQQANQRSGGLRAIVYASGVNIPQPYVSQTVAEQWREVVETELMGFIALVRQALPILREHRGSIVNIGSVAPHWFIPGDALSAVPKAATETLCRAVAKEEGRYGVRANTVAPGIMETGIGGNLMRTSLTAEIWEQQKKRTPLRRFGLSEDIAGATAFLCSSEASFITGQTLIVDGGLSL